jgi:hypothetical protein
MQVDIDMARSLADRARLVRNAARQPGVPGLVEGEQATGRGRPAEGCVSDGQA